MTSLWLSFITSACCVLFNRYLSSPDQLAGLSGYVAVLASQVVDQCPTPCVGQ